jgi:hypothetical protein
MVKVSADQMRWFRWWRSGLVEPFDDAVTAASRLGGIQAQILSAAAVALWNRTPHLTYTQFEKMLFTDRILVKLWGQRGTFFFERPLNDLRYETAV